MPTAPVRERTKATPKWTSGTKLVAGFTMVAIVAALLIRFNSLLAPLLLAFILSYLLHPVVTRFSEATKLPWRPSVNLIFVVFILIIIAVVTLAGFAVVEQLGSLVTVSQSFLAGLPEFAANLGEQRFQLGPFDVDFSELERLLLEELNMDFATLGQQALSALQPALGQAGSLVGTVATSFFTTLGWSLFIFVISYFVLADSGEVPSFSRNIKLPGHGPDIRRMGRELGRIWNAFLRGQLFLIILIVISSFLLMSFLGVHNALGLAFLAGLAKFVPYIGPLIAGIATALVAFFQGGNYLHIEPPLTYAIIVVVAAVILDQIFDNLVTPRIYGAALGVHPAAVLVAALIAANLLGLVGLVLAAPVLASLQLFLTYAIRKMVDMNPWPEPESDDKDIEYPLARPLQALIKYIKELINRVRSQLRRRKSKKA